MLSSIPAYILYLIAIVASALISMYSVRKILFITRSRKIYDIPDDIRKIHGAEIPSLGGIGIFIGYIIVALVFWPIGQFPISFFLPASVLLFFAGIYDDLMNMKPSKKLVAQLLASAITVYFSDIRIISFYGLLGIETLPYEVSLFITIVGCTLFINAFNFIDGIDGLACTLAILYCVVLAVVFNEAHREGLTLVALSLAGGTAGLLAYNLAPAKIYMGDTGSMLLGFTIFILSVVFVNVYGGNATNGVQVASPAIWVHSKAGAMLVVLSILFLPVYDAIRVFILRLSRGKSPLHADRTHLHYYLLDAGFGHTKSVVILLITNIALIAVALLMQDGNPLIAVAAMVVVASLVLLGIYMLRQRHRAADFQLAREAK